MEIKPPQIKVSSPSGATSIKSVLNQWRTGEILNATIVSRPKSDSFILKVGTDTLQATGKPPAQLAASLEAGTKLKLEVLQTSPQLTLKVIPNTVSAATNALRQHLPKQTSLAPLLANLMTLGQSSSQLPANLAKSIENLLKTLPSAQDALKGHAKIMQRMLKESGIFLERHLSESNAPTSHSRTLNADFKANLLKVLQQLQNYQKQAQTAPKKVDDPYNAPLSQRLPLQAPGAATTSNTPPSSAPRAPEPPSSPQTPTTIAPTLKNAALQAQARSQPTLNPTTPLTFIVEELSKQIEGAISRIRVTQLANIPSDTNQPLNLNVEFPVRRELGIDLFQLRIEEDDENNKHSSGKTPVWKVTLAFHFDELGPVYANISVFEETVSATLHAELDKTRKLIDDNLNTLSKDLNEAGLNVKKLICLTGKPMHSSNTRIFQSILDIKA